MSQVLLRRAAGAEFRVTATARPLFVAVESSVSTSGSLAVSLPAGWEAGQLAVMHVARGSAAPATPVGWTTIGSSLSSNTGTSALFYRVLQIGDSGPTLDSGTNTAAVVWTFATDTFNPSTPVVQIASNTSAGGLSASCSVPASSDVTAGEHYVVHISNTYNVFNTVSAYPYASAQHNRGIGSAPSFVANRGCGQNFDGGVSATSAITISASAYWMARKIAIIGLGYSP